MNQILVCIMGLSPGVVTRMVQYLRQEADPNVTLSEVHVITTSNPTSQQLYRQILCTELNGHLQLENRHKLSRLSVSDVTTSEQVTSFFTELTVELEKRLRPQNTVIHLCISGGRKSMTYAASMAVQQLAIRFGKQVTSKYLRVWHVQLEHDEEPSGDDIRVLIDNYRTRQVRDDARERILYPRSAHVIKLRYFQFLNRGELTPDLDVDLLANVSPD